MPEILDLNKFLISCLLFFLTDIVVWFQINGYKVSDAINRNQIAWVLILGMPIALGYFYAWKFAYVGLGSWWSCRLLGFGISFLIFPVLTHFLLGESMFRPKIITCVLLSVVIVMAQVYWPEEKSNVEGQLRRQNENVRECNELCSREQSSSGWKN